MHLTLVPYIPSARELKTKPTQHSVKELRSIGILPDILLCRADREIPISDKKKIALFCNLPQDCVIPAIDVKTIYQAPLVYHANGLDSQVLKCFKIEDAKEPNLKIWEDIVERVFNPSDEVIVAIVGKYIKLRDAYKSITEAIDHAGIAQNLKVKVKWVNARRLTDENIEEKLGNVHAILVPGGFGQDGIEGKIKAINYARTKNIPFLGICLGMQLAVIEAARNICGIQDASSTEFGLTDNPVVGLMTEWVKAGKVEKRSEEGDMGGTMRLGSYGCKIQPGSLAEKVYKNKLIHERHRHRFEVNTNYIDNFQKHGIIFSGMSPDGKLPEIMELQAHPWFIGVQFHPELKSRPFSPHPLFYSFIEAALKHFEQIK
jgi:CTP synthase